MPGMLLQRSFLGNVLVVIILVMVGQDTNLTILDLQLVDPAIRLLPLQIILVGNVHNVIILVVGWVELLITAVKRIASPAKLMMHQVITTQDSVQAAIILLQAG